MKKIFQHNRVYFSWFTIRYFKLNLFRHFWMSHKCDIQKKISLKIVRTFIFIKLCYKINIINNTIFDYFAKQGIFFAKQDKFFAIGFFSSAIWYLKIYSSAVCTRDILTKMQVQTFMHSRDLIIYEKSWFVLSAAFCRLIYCKVSWNISKIVFCSDIFTKQLCLEIKNKFFNI